MLHCLKKISFFLFLVFIFTAISYPGVAQASFWNTIRAWVTINPLDVDVSAPAEVEQDKVFKIEARIINKGNEKIKSLKAEIHLPVGLTLLKKNTIQNAGVLSGDKEKNVFFGVKGNEIGNHFVLVSVSGELKGELISAQDTAIVKIKKATTSLQQKQNSSSGFFQTFLTFFQQWFNN